MILILNRNFSFQGNNVMCHPVVLLCLEACQDEEWDQEEEQVGGEEGHVRGSPRPIKV